MAVIVPLFAPVTFVERGWLSANGLAVTKRLQTWGSAYLHRDLPNTNNNGNNDDNEVIDDIDARKCEYCLT